MFSPATDAKINTEVSKVLTVATRINTLTGRLMKTTGPLVITGICLAQPEYCSPAKAAYSLALAAQKEYASVLADAIAANVAPDGTKLATLAGTFQAHFSAINSLVVAGGGTDNTSAITELGGTITELKNIK
jgi:hypothetical protein